MEAATVALRERMQTPAVVIPEAMKPIEALYAAAGRGGVAQPTLALVHLRASQINGYSICVESGSLHARRTGANDERLAAVAAWRDSPRFSDADRAALALTEASPGSATDRARSLPRPGMRPPSTSTSPDWQPSS